MISFSHFLVLLCALILITVVLHGAVVALLLWRHEQREEKAREQFHQAVMDVKRMVAPLIKSRDDFEAQIRDVKNTTLDLLNRVERLEVFHRAGG